MIKKSFLYANVILILAFCAETGYAAELSGSVPLQIVVRHAVAKTESGNKHIGIHLIAKDGNNLHENQIYQARFMGANPAKHQDARYDELGEEIFIPRLVQRGSRVYQATLKMISRKPLEFIVIETTLLSSDPENNSFFDPSSIHNVGIPDLDR